MFNLFSCESDAVPLEVLLLRVLVEVLLANEEIRRSIPRSKR